MYRFPLLRLLASASLLVGAACQESTPLGPGESGNPDLPGPGSIFHESGSIASASLSGSDPSLMTIVLGGNVEVRVTDATVIDAGGDLTTLDEVLAAIEAGIPVRIEIDGTVTDGVIAASRVRFETDGAGTADDEVHAVVAAVDVGARTVTLADGRAIRIASDALIETDGDFLTLAQVAAALAHGLEIRVEANLGPTPQGIREATSAKFESDQADGPGDDDGDDNSGPGNAVAAVDLVARTVTTSAGPVIRVASDDLIDADGDILTLAEVASRLASEAPIRVEAHGATVNGVFVATLAKFEVDD